MDAGAWLRLAQLIIAAGGLVALFLTLWQKWLSDNRAEWWKRFTWALENAYDANATKQKQNAARIELDELATSPLAGANEWKLIDEFYRNTSNDTGKIEEKDGENNEHLD